MTAPDSPASANVRNPKPQMSTPPGRKGKERCRTCGDTLHWLGAGWGHDRDNMATCIPEYERTGRAIVAVPK